MDNMLGQKRIITSAFCFRNGAIAICDQAGEQICELQMGWPTLWAENAERNGYDPVGVIFEIQGGNKIRITRHEDRYGWEFVNPVL